MADANLIEWERFARLQNEDVDVKVYFGAYSVKFRVVAEVVDAGILVEATIDEFDDRQAAMDCALKRLERRYRAVAAATEVRHG